MLFLFFLITLFSICFFRNNYSITRFEKKKQKTILSVKNNHNLFLLRKLGVHLRLNNVFVVVVISDEKFDDFGLQTFDFLFDTTKKIIDKFNARFCVFDNEIKNKITLKLETRRRKKKQAKNSIRKHENEKF